MKMWALHVSNITLFGLSYFLDLHMLVANVESAVKIVKQYFVKIVTNASLSQEEDKTFLCELKAIIISDRYQLCQRIQMIFCHYYLLIFWLVKIRRQY